MSLQVAFFLESPDTLANTLILESCGSLNRKQKQKNFFHINKVEKTKANKCVFFKLLNVAAVMDDIPIKQQ